MFNNKLNTIFFKMMFFVLVGTVLFIMGCDEDNPVEPDSPEGFGKELVIDASGSSDWVYFSFADSQVVAIDDPASSTDWDLGLRRYHLCTNSGTSGSGKGGALDLGEVEFVAVTTVPAEGYTVDDSVAYEGHGGTTMYSVNPVLETWAAMEGMPPTFVPSNHIFAVKTAGGKYVKLWLKNYYNNEGASGYITIQYYYQADGSTDFED